MFDNVTHKVIEKIIISVLHVVLANTCARVNKRCPCRSMWLDNNLHSNVIAII